MATGTVRWFNSTIGFGFIRTDDGLKNVVVDVTAVEEAGLSALEEGQNVQFDLVKSRNGEIFAGNLKIIFKEGLPDLQVAPKINADRATQLKREAVSGQTESRSVPS